MVYITGDTHGDFHRFALKNFQQQKNMTKDDFVIIAGDFGGVWYNNRQEHYWLEWLDDKPFTTLFVDGNHENFDLLGIFPVNDFHGGKVHTIRSSVHHLMRGYVFDLCDKKFFAFGGAASHDISDGVLDLDEYKNNWSDFLKVYRAMKDQGKMFRVKGISWWPEELPSYDECKLGLDTLGGYDYKVDFVITHCLPQNVASLIGFTGSDTATTYFDKIILDQNLDFDKWYCGHYHTELQALSKYNVLYRSIIRAV